MVRVVSRVPDGHVLKNLQYVTRMQSFQYWASRPPYCTIHVNLFFNHGLHHGRKYKRMSISPVAVKFSVMNSTNGVPSSSARLSLISMGTRILSP